jgi:hypothetical protein
MINLAIAMDIDRNNNSIIETNCGKRLVAPDWPQDCETKLVSFREKGRLARVVDLETLTEDIREALTLIDQQGAYAQKKPNWFLRLQKISAV